MLRLWLCPNNVAKNNKWLPTKYTAKGRFNVPALGLGCRNYSSLKPSADEKWTKPVGLKARYARTHFFKIPFTLAARETLDPFASLLQHIAPDVGFDPTMVQRLDMDFKLQNFILVDFATTPEMKERAIHFEQLNDVMESLKDPIRALRSGQTGPIKIPFGAIRPMMHVRRTDYDPHSTLVVFIQPSAGPAYDMLHNITDLLHARLLRKGLICDSDRRTFPPSLTMTILNGRQALQGDGEDRMFDLVKLYNHPALDKYRKQSAPTPMEEDIHSVPLELDLGTVQLEGLIFEQTIRKGEQRPIPMWQCEF